MTNKIKPNGLMESLENAKRFWDSFPEWKKEAFKIKGTDMSSKVKIYESEEEEMASSNLIFRSETGSRLYGTSTQDSDIDIVGIFVPNANYIYGLKSIEQISKQTETVDYTYYSIIKFFKLALNNNPNILSVLYTPEKNIISMHMLGKMILDSRHIFTSKKCIQTYFGYASAQRHKIILKDKVNGKRMELIEKYGYDVKFAMHLIRLLLEVKDILTDGGIVYPSRNIDELIKIRNGSYSQGEVLTVSYELEREIKSLSQTSKLRDEPDYQAAELLQMNIIEAFLNNQRIQYLERFSGRHPYNPYY